MTPILESVVPLLRGAQAESLGLLVRTSDPERLRALLYRARRELADPALAGLQFRMWPGDEAQVAIVCGPPPASTPQDLGL
jgi:hypothetical protein